MLICYVGLIAHCVCVSVSCHLRDQIVLWCVGEGLQEALDATAAAMLMERVNITILCLVLQQVVRDRCLLI